MAGLIPVRSKTVVAVQLYRWRPTLQRLDVWPFFIAYAVWLCVSPTTLRLPAGEVIAGLVVLACLQILAALFTVWSVEFRCLVAATKVSSVYAAEVCKVIPARFAGSKAVVPIMCRQQQPAERMLLGVPASTAAAAVASEAASGLRDSHGHRGSGGRRVGEEEVRFEFRKQQFVYCAGQKEAAAMAAVNGSVVGEEGEGEGSLAAMGAVNGSQGGAWMGSGRASGGASASGVAGTAEDVGECFFELQFPCELPVGQFVAWKGHSSQSRVEAARARWGRNVFEFPAPTFMKLYQEQCSEPFFVFQVFCVALWCLDTYWYYSLFTLFMLLVFESTVVTSRLRTLSELRRVRVDAQALMAFREGKWQSVAGPDLVPGDVVSVARQQASNSGSGSSKGNSERTLPADMLLLAGAAIANESVLTGESTPQWKTAPTGRDLSERLSLKRDKAHLLFGGTKLLQHTADVSATLQLVPIKPPDNGCIAVVLRTGFDTSQGSLMRTILFSTERLTANTLESGMFILFLVVFALVAAGYVMYKGLEDPHRSRYKLLLECSLIITSVIPPELPMELSIAVNTSLIALVKKGIFCTEPFRIPAAGKVDVCCFDKTGTLTSDDMEFRGVVGAYADGSLDLCSSTDSLPLTTRLALAACHSLVLVDGKMVGDPLEKAAVAGVGWSLTQDGRVLSKGMEAQIAQRYHFASHLKRMAAVLRVSSEHLTGYIAVVKGAPETIEQRLSEVPAGYAAGYKQFTRQGARVLALAYRRIEDLPVSDIRSMDRDVVESGLTFAGFAVFACPIRSDSASVLLDLRNSSHDLIMITGDQPLTACHVATQVHIISRPVLILSPSLDSDTPSVLQWQSPDEATQLPFSVSEVAQLASTYDMCLAGDALPPLHRMEALPLLLPYVQVYARVSPEHKELLLQLLKAAGRTTLMCGDGTNDVGALKQAHVGVALLNAVPPARPAAQDSTADEPSAGTSTSHKAGPHAHPSTRTPAPPSSSSSSTSSAHSSSSAGSGNAGHTSRAAAAIARKEQHQRRLREQQEKLQRMMKELQEEGDARAAPTVKLGDASMASPFTAKHASVSPTKDILLQGRATLVTTLQMFKILGLNCLASAYVMSVMSLDGVKIGDAQATIAGVFTAAFFLFLSQARPLAKLSAERPHPHVFSAYVLLSIIGQFVLHLGFLMLAVEWSRKYMPEECIEPDSPFAPNLVNTVAFSVRCLLQLFTFAVNYVGHPFNESITENKPFCTALFGASAFFVIVASDLVRPLNDSLSLVPLPTPMALSLLPAAALVLALCFLWEQLLRWVFPAPGPTKWNKRARQAAVVAAGVGKERSGMDGDSEERETTLLQKKYE